MKISEDKAMFNFFNLAYVRKFLTLCNKQQPIMMSKLMFLLRFASLPQAITHTP